MNLAFKSGGSRESHRRPLRSPSVCCVLNRPVPPPMSHHRREVRRAALECSVEEPAVCSGAGLCNSAWLPSLGRSWHGRQAGRQARILGSWLVSSGGKECSTIAGLFIVNFSFEAAFLDSREVTSAARDGEEQNESFQALMRCMRDPS